MKTILILAACISLASTFTACKGTQAEQQAQLSQFANIAVNVLATTNPDKAVLIRSGGALVTSALSGGGVDAVAASNLAVDLAVDKGKLTQAQADALKAANTVPLNPVTPVIP